MQRALKLYAAAGNAPGGCGALSAGRGDGLSLLGKAADGGLPAAAGALDARVPRRAV